MEPDIRRLQNIRSLALVLTALSFLIILVSAYIRLNGAGLGCAGWPDCYGQLLAGTPHPHSGGVRILHRIVASTALLLGFFLAWRCARPHPLQPVASQATVLVALMILLTFIGLWSSDAHRAWASFFNILGGATLVVLSWRLVLTAGQDASRPKSSRAAILQHAGLGLLALVIALGALIGARYAASACTSLPWCGGVSWPVDAGWAALNPFTTVVAPAAPGDDGGVALHLLHRYGALASLLLLGMAGLQALLRPATRRAAGALLLLLLIQFALGVLIVLSGFSLWLAVAHSVCAAGLLMVAAQLLIQSRIGAD